MVFLHKYIPSWLREYRDAIKHAEKHNDSRFLLVHSLVIFSAYAALLLPVYVFIKIPTNHSDNLIFLIPIIIYITLGANFSLVAGYSLKGFWSMPFRAVTLVTVAIVAWAFADSHVCESSLCGLALLIMGVWVVLCYLGAVLLYIFARGARRWPVWLIYILSVPLYLTVFASVRTFLEKIIS